MIDEKGEPSPTEESGRGGADDAVPALFATIHFRSETRKDGLTSDEIELLSIEANRHIPDLYEKLKAAREERLAKEATSKP